MQQRMEHGCSYLTLTAFPRLGASTSHWRERQANRSPLHQFVSLTSRHQAVLENIRSGRGRDVEIRVPIYRDEHTPWPLRDPSVNPSSSTAGDSQSAEGSISMDSTVSALSCCSLQVTMQLQDISEARRLYDKLSPLAPIMLALTAATTVWKGLLADTDVRWNAMSASIDDRSVEQLNDMVKLFPIFLIQAGDCKLTIDYNSRKTGIKIPSSQE